MNRSPAVLWIGVVLLLLLPTAAGRLLLDLAGGVLLALMALPLILSGLGWICLLYTSPSPRDKRQSRMPSSA